MEPGDRKGFTALRNSNLKTARALALKESAMALFTYFYERSARKHFPWWHGWAIFESSTVIHRECFASSACGRQSLPSGQFKSASPDNRGQGSLLGS
jgi:hypothetical protein